MPESVTISVVAKGIKVTPENKRDFCEYDQPPEEGFDLYSPDYDGLLKYCEKRFKRRDRDQAA